MRWIAKFRGLAGGIVIGLSCAGCDDGFLRGAVEQSRDGATYLAVIDDSGGGCGPIKVDGKVWQLPIGVPGAIEPGSHTIECGITLSFEIPAGVIFRFDYWGP